MSTINAQIWLNLWEAGAVLKMNLPGCNLQIFDCTSVNGGLGIVCSVLVCLMGMFPIGHAAVLIVTCQKRGQGTKILRWWLCCWIILSVCWCKAAEMAGLSLGTYIFFLTFLKLIVRNSNLAFLPASIYARWLQRSNTGTHLLISWNGRSALLWQITPLSFW